MSRCIGLSKYTFEIQQPHASSIGLHISNIEFVGARAEQVQMVSVKDGDYCVKAGTQLSDRKNGVSCPENLC